MSSAIFKRGAVLLVAALACLGGVVSSNIANAQSRSNPSQVPSVNPAQHSVRPSMFQLNNPSLSTAVFIENAGQFNPKVRFQVKVGGQTAWLTDKGIVFDATRPKQDANETITATTFEGLLPSLDLFTPLAARNPEKPQSRTIERLVFSEDFVKASCCSKIEGKGTRTGGYNYFQGNDPAKWRTGVHVYSEVVYRNVWDGVDLRIYGKGPDLEQEFIVQPGADLTQVEIAYRGIEKLGVAGDGSLEVYTAFGLLRETSPLIYQEIAGKRETVNGRFDLRTPTSYGFQVDPYESEYALAIDPTLLYSTFLGGSAGDYAWNVFNTYFGYTLDEYAAGIAVDASGNAYVAGHTASTDFPITTGAFQTTGGGGFLTKLNATGSALVYSTYLGASISAVAVDSTGSVYVTGGGALQNFPTTSSAYYPTDSNHHCNQDLFLAVLNSTGDKLTYSTCFGAISANPAGIAVDSSGKAFIAGSVSGSVPTTSNAQQASYPGAGSAAFAMAIDTTKSGTSSLVFSTYLGLSGTAAQGAYANSVAVDAFGNAYVAGSATAGLPVTAGAFQTAHKGDNSCYHPCEYNPCAPPSCHDAFVAKLNPLASSGISSLIYLTYLGGNGEDSAGGITVDAASNAYVVGTNNYGDYPVTPGAFQTNRSSGYNGSAFITKLNAAGSALVYSTYLHSTSAGDDTTGSAIGLDSLGNAYVTGNTYAPDFPVTADAAQTIKRDASHDFSEAFLTKLNATGSSLLYSSYLGGSGNDVANALAVDLIGDAYVTGYTESPNFPVNAAFQPVLNPNPTQATCSANTGGRLNGCHGGDAFVTKFPVAAVFRVLGLSISRGGNAGQVTPTVFGSGFHAGGSAALIGGSRTIPATQVTLGPLGQFLYPTFDLTGAPPGLYSVSVSNSDGSSQILLNSFTVEQGGTSDVWTDIVGRTAMRGGREQVYTITVGNRGTADRNSYRFWVSFPSYLTYRLLSGSSPTVKGNDNGTSYLAFDIPKVAAGATVSYVLGLTVPDNPIYGHVQFQVQLWKEGR